MARGFEEAGNLFDRLAADARERAGFMLFELSGEISAAQKAQLGAKTSGTGYLSGGIEAEVLLEKLRMRSGLLALQQGRRNSRYYGRFVELGRRAQIVQVIRGTAASTKSASSRRKRAAGVTLRKPYTLRVRAMAPREFIALPDVEQRVLRRTANFWAELLPAD